MSLVGRRSYEADKVDFFETADELASDYRNSAEPDPSSEIVIAEIGRDPVAYSKIWVSPGANEEVVFWHASHVVPEWRRTGLRQVLLRFSESNIVSMASQRGIHMSCPCRVWALDEPNDWRDLIIAEGYTPGIHFYEMVRPTLNDVPETPLPKGLELRPVKPEDYPKVWNASKEAFRGKPWFVEGQYDMKYYNSWVGSPEFMPELWRVAWDGDEIAGMARNHVILEENLKLGRKRGHTQHLSVMPKWRRRGLGKALLGESLRMMRDLGLEEAALDMESQSTTGELDLYLSMGYEIHRRYAHYAKQLTVD
ncbi:MAG: GNAT family N-acetyltransferase [Thermoplasmata archaeon]|nr:GNAT family N-acetyltransferase [Thermoplasmata archaeon]